MNRPKVDPILALSGLVLLVLVVTHAVPLAWSHLAAFTFYSIQLPLHVLTITAFFHGLHRTKHPEAKRFWKFMAIGYVALIVGNEFRGTWQGGDSDIATGVLDDGIYLAFYVAVLWAVELRPDRRPGWTRGRAANRTALTVGLLSLGTLFTYFVFIPAWASEAFYLGSTPSLRFFVAADAMIFLRLLYLGSRSGSGQWRVLYLVIAGSMGTWLVADGFGLLDNMGVFDYPSEPAADVLWHLPYFLVIAATRFRNYAASRTPVQSPTTGAQAITWEAVVYPLGCALGLTLLHMLLRETTKLAEPALSLRDFAILLASTGLVGLSLAQRRGMRESGRGQKEITLFLSDDAFAQSRKMEALGRLAGGVAHDFNNLLFVMQAHSESLQNALARDRPEYKCAEEMSKTVKRASSLTHQLLAFSRKRVLEPRVLDLSVIVEEAKQLLRRMVREDITLVTRNAENLGRVKADPGQITQVIFNLAINACDAMPEGGRLEVGTENVEFETTSDTGLHAPEQGSRVRLYVRDDGDGMDEQTRARMFEPFFTTKDEGTGLGLATVYGIVRQSGGRIVVESQPGHGATFSVYLPRVDEETPVDPVPVATQPTDREGHETILLAEDDAAVRELACDYLRSKGYRVLVSCV